RHSMLGSKAASTAGTLPRANSLYRSLMKIMWSMAAPRNLALFRGSEVTLQCVRHRLNVLRQCASEINTEGHHDGALFGRLIGQARIRETRGERARRQRDSKFRVLRIDAAPRRFDRYLERVAFEFRHAA